MSLTTDHPDIALERCLDEAHERSLAEDVLDGLTRPFKELPPKHFYDERGCELFDRTPVPEYYHARRAKASQAQRRQPWPNRRPDSSSWAPAAREDRACSRDAARPLRRYVPSSG